MVDEARRDAGPGPRSVAVMSPWTDLALSGETLETRAEADPLLTKESLAGAASMYLGNHDSSGLCCKNKADLLRLVKKKKKRTPS